MASTNIVSSAIVLVVWFVVTLPFLRCQTRKYKVIFQNPINKLDSGIRLWVAWEFDSLLDIYRLRKDIHPILPTLWALVGGYGNAGFTIRKRRIMVRRNLLLDTIEWDVRNNKPVTLGIFPHRSFIHVYE